ncbi:hypothetical protein B0H17DRAFT_1213390 [Mycena rosella]|uniref:Uncharacterized protein n=1 Tax=Mycena rosella TaxID=1033263 RepID=A0AAD7CQ53_MYCRO|nr:hypothetical protein B0H17DRAFT_1213390 [Mycena rosella]
MRFTPESSALRPKRARTPSSRAFLAPASSQACSIPPKSHVRAPAPAFPPTPVPEPDSNAGVLGVKIAEQLYERVGAAGRYGGRGRSVAFPLKSHVVEGEHGEPDAGRPERCQVARRGSACAYERRSAAQATHAETHAATGDTGLGRPERALRSSHTVDLPTRTSA